MDIDTCVGEGFLQKITPKKEVQEKEMNAAGYDLKRAEFSFTINDCKWSTIQSYYTIFHAARALLNKFGYREKRHFAVGIVLEHLAKKGQISVRLVNDFHAAISAREDADYRDVYSKETAEYLIEISKEFFHEIKNILKEQ